MIGRLATFVAVLALVPSLARADPPPPEAKIHFDSGRDYYQQEKYDDAVREFKRAYEIAPLPDLLINIARAETHLGHEESAIAYLERYLEARPDADDAPSVRAEIDARKRALADAAAAARAKAEAERAKAEAEKATEVARAVRDAARPRWPGVTFTVVGAALLLVGALSGLAALADAHIVSTGGTMSASKQPADWSTVAKSQSDGLGFNAGAIALDVLGALCASVGVGLLVWSTGGPKVERAKRVWLAPSASGLAVGGAF